VCVCREGESSSKQGKGQAANQTRVERKEGGSEERKERETIHTNKHTSVGKERVAQTLPATTTRANKTQPLSAPIRSMRAPPRGPAKMLLKGKGGRGGGRVSGRGVRGEWMQ